MFKAVQSHTFGDKPSSAVSAWVDHLCQPRYQEDDLEGIPELVQAVELQPATGATEASRALRKKLKYSNLQGQLRALTILKALVENCGDKFINTFADDALIDRIKITVGDPTADARLKRKILSVLAGWSRQFRDDPKMASVAGLYAACGGGSAAGKRVATKSVASEAYTNQNLRYEREAAERAERKAKERDDKDAAKEKAALEKAQAKAKKNQPAKGKRIPFNFEAEKPKIMASVGTATQSSQNLNNALMFVDREKESVTTNVRVIECLEKLKVDRKIVVRYIQRVENDPSGEFIGTLLATNEQILAAFALYDRMSKPVELDSDDEHVSETRNARQADDDDDTISIRSRLSAFDISRDTEVDKLQKIQRRRVERVKSGGIRLHPDLVDLSFSSPAHKSLNPASRAPIQRTLSEYSEGSDASSIYSSDDDYGSSTAPSTSHTTSATSSAKSYAQYIQKDDEQSRRNKGLLEEDEEELDPFADPFADQTENRAREEWKEL